MPTYTTTAKLALRWLTGANPVSDIDAGFQALAEDIDASLSVTIPQLITALDVVPLVPQYTNIDSLAITTGGAPFGGAKQTAALVYLPRRIVNATRLRWKYLQDATTAITGNYRIALYNTAGAKILETGSVAFTGATNSVQVRAETISTTTFEAGLYYVFMGTSVSAGQCLTRGVTARSGPSAYPTPVFPNVVLRAATGGVTAPADLLALTDVGPSTSTFETGIPTFALSVG